MDYKKILSNSRFWLIIAVVLIFIASIFQESYFVGGDDTRLYYIYPEKYLNNFSSNLIIDTAVSGFDKYFPQNYIIPFNLLLILLNKVIPFSNLQFLFFLTNIALGVFFFYKLIFILIPIKDKKTKYGVAATSVLYALSIFNVYSFFSHQLFAQYLLTFYPLTLYLFIRSVKEGKYIYLVTGSLVLSVFSIVLLSLPWLLALILVTLPLFIYLFTEYKNKFINHVLVFSALLFVLNFHWIIHILITVFSPGTSTGAEAFLAEDYRTSAEFGIRTTTKLNSVFFPLINLYHYLIQVDFRWMQNMVFERWYLMILPLNIVFPLIIVGAGFLIKKSDNYFKLFTALMTSWILAIYFFTVNVSRLGVDLFVFMSTNVPGFVMFRNMYDKFAPAMAFAYAMVLAVGLIIIFQKIKSTKIKNVLLFIYTISIILQIYPFTSGQFDLPIWKTADTYQKLDELNTDYLALASYVENIADDSLFLSLPLTLGNNALIQDEFAQNHYYSGVSPLLIMSGRNDFSGLLSFEHFAEPFDDALRNKDYEQVRSLLQKLNVGYVVVNHSVSEDLLGSYHFEGGFYEIQEGLLEEVAGEKIRDFGDRYSLYEVKSEYEPRYIFINNGIEVFDPVENAQVEYIQVSQGEYEVKLRNIPAESYLIFLEPYNEHWDLRPKDGDKMELEQTAAFDYANVWQLKEDLDEQVLYINFSPYRYHSAAVYISFGTFLIAAIYLATDIIRNRKQDKHD